MRRVLTGVLLAAVILPAIVAMLWRLTGGTMLTVQTNSMLPTFRAGDVLLVRPINRPPRAGEVISYRSNQRSEVIVSHRVQQVFAQKTSYVTQGDALAQADLPIRAYQLVGRPIAVLPLLGTVVQWFRSPIGLGVGIYMPAALIIGLEVRRIIR